MTIFSGVVVFILTWWMVFFCMLPLGIRNIEKPKRGEMPGAPVDPGLKRKLILTTLVACVVWVVLYFIITSNLISFHDQALGMRM